MPAGVRVETRPREPDCHERRQHHRGPGHQGRSRHQAELLFPGRVPAGDVPALLPVRLYIRVQDEAGQDQDAGRLHPLVRTSSQGQQLEVFYTFQAGKKFTKSLPLLKLPLLNSTIRYLLLFIMIFYLTTYSGI